MLFELFISVGLTRIDILSESAKKKGRLLFYNSKARSDSLEFIVHNVFMTYCESALTRLNESDQTVE